MCGRDCTGGMAPAQGGKHEAPRRTPKDPPTPGTLCRRYFPNLSGGEAPTGRPSAQQKSNLPVRQAGTSQSFALRNSNLTEGQAKTKRPGCAGRFVGNGKTRRSGERFALEDSGRRRARKPSTRTTRDDQGRVWYLSVVVEFRPLNGGGSSCHRPRVFPVDL